MGTGRSCPVTAASVVSEPNCSDSEAFKKREPQNDRQRPARPRFRHANGGCSEDEAGSSEGTGSESAGGIGHAHFLKPGSGLRASGSIYLVRSSRERTERSRLGRRHSAASTRVDSVVGDRRTMLALTTPHPDTGSGLLRQKENPPSPAGSERAGDRARTGDIQLGRERARADWSRLVPPRCLAMRILGRAQRQQPTATDTGT
jgi:hypothetical protein